VTDTAEALQVIIDWLATSADAVQRLLDDPELSAGLTASTTAWLRVWLHVTDAMSGRAEVRPAVSEYRWQLSTTQYVGAHRHLQLATSDDGGPWLTAGRLALDEGQYHDLLRRLTREGDAVELVGLTDSRRAGQ